MLVPASHCAPAACTSTSPSAPDGDRCAGRVDHRRRQKTVKYASQPRSRRLIGAARSSRSGRAPVNPPRCDSAAHRRQLLRRDRRKEGREDLPRALVVRPPRPEHVATERERDLLVVPAAIAVLAVHDPRLVGVEAQPDISQSTRDRIPHNTGLTFTDAMDHRIVRKALELDGRELPAYPGIEPIMQEQVGEAGEIGLPCGVPLTLGARVPSGLRIGAFTQRSTYSTTHCWSVWCATAFSVRSHGTESKKARMSRSSTQSFLKHRSRQTAIASTARAPRESRDARGASRRSHGSSKRTPTSSRPRRPHLCP